jgi:hypothetical protein
LATRGLSLVGFYDREQDALAHLRGVCLLKDMSDAALLQEWAAARARLGTASSTPRLPEIREFPRAEAAYIRELRALPWVQALLQRPAYRGASFRLVEIAPLLAHQPFVDLDRVDRAGQALIGAGGDELTRICLPNKQPKPLEQPTVILQQWDSIIIKSRKAHIEAFLPSLATIDQNGYEHTIAGVSLEWSLPFVHVVRLNGRYILRSGYHRVFGAGKRGATYIPCLVRDYMGGNGSGGDAEPLNWLLMPQRLLEAADPPTLGHFIDGRAHEVMLRATSLVMQVTWSHNVLPDEYDGL